MTAGSQARDKNEWFELINQALDKAGDLAAAIEYDEYLPAQGDWLDFSKCFAKYPSPGRRVLADIKNDPGNLTARIPGTELAHLPRKVGDHGGSSHFIARETGPGSTLVH